jgi:hypothetical protein
VFHLTINFWLSDRLNALLFNALHWSAEGDLTNAAAAAQAHTNQ